MKRWHTTESTTNNSGGISLLGLLGVVFITLKLCKVIDWSWWWVTAPLWGPYAALLIILLVVGIGLAVFGAVVFVYEKLVVERRYARLAKKLRE